MERRAIEEEEEVEQPIEIKQLTDFSLVLVEGGFFDVEVDSFNIPIDVPTKARSKYMMRHKGKE